VVKKINVGRLPDNCEFDVPLELAAAMTDLTLDMTAAMTPRASRIHNDILLNTFSQAAELLLLRLATIEFHYALQYETVVTCHH